MVAFLGWRACAEVWCSTTCYKLQAAPAATQAASAPRQASLAAAHAASEALNNSRFGRQGGLARQSTKTRRVARAANNLQAGSAGNSRLTVRPMTTDVVFTTQLRDPLLTGCQGGRASKTTRAEIFRRLRMAETGVQLTLRMTLFDSMFHDRSQHSNTTRATLDDWPTNLE